MLARCLVLSCALLLAACSSTRIASTWRDAADSGATLKKVAIFVALKDDALRRLGENQAVNAMPKGTVGVPGHTLFDKAEIDIEALRVKLTAQGFDGALIARLVAHDRKQTYHPPQSHLMMADPFPAYAPYYRSFYYYFPQAYTYTTPAFISQTETILVETMLYRLPSGKPAWSAVSESVNPDSTLDLIDEIVAAVGGELRKQGLIAQQ